MTAETLAPSTLPALLKLHAALVWKPDLLFRLLEQWGSADAVLGLSALDLAKDGALGLAVADGLLKRASDFDAEGELAKLADCGGRVLVYGREGYPALLQSAPDAPLLLYVRGDADLTGPGLAVVGTRRPTPYGRRTARKFAEEAARAGLVVVSGLARGVDSAAHQAVLDAGGRTWAVLGSGLLRPYPAENAKLLEAIAKSGAVISEFPLETPPTKENFPRRNRVISGLSLGTLVVEGDLHSGAMITARCAIEQGRDVFAVPGPIDSEMSRAPHLLLRQGAKLAESLEDVLEELPIPRPPSRSAARKPVQGEFVSEEEGRVLEALGPGTKSVDEMVETLGWDVPRVHRILFDLEMREVVTLGPGRRYAKS